MANNQNFTKIALLVAIIAAVGVGAIGYLLGANSGGNSSDTANAPNSIQFEGLTVSETNNGGYEIIDPNYGYATEEVQHSEPSSKPTPAYSEPRWNGEAWVMSLEDCGVDHSDLLLLATDVDRMLVCLIPPGQTLEEAQVNAARAMGWSEEIKPIGYEATIFGWSFNNPALYALVSEADAGGGIDTLDEKISECIESRQNLVCGAYGINAGAHDLGQLHITIYD